MSGKTIEDILINKDYKKVVKKKNNMFVIIFLIILICILAGLGIFAWKHIEANKEVTAKDLFLKYVLTNNINELLTNDLYKESYKKIGEDDVYMDTRINFSTTSEIEGYEGFDFSKFTIDNNLIKRKSDKRIFTNSIIKYLDNDVFDLKTISQDNNFAISSEQIVTKYISGNTDQMNNLIKQVTGADVNLNFGKSMVESIGNSEEIELTEKNVLTIKKDITKILEKNITDENVTQKEIIVDSNGNQVQTTAYIATLNKKQVLDITKEIVKELSSSKVIDRIVSDKNSTSIFEIGSTKEYETNPEVSLENIIDSSEFIVGAEPIQDEVVENIIEEGPVSGTITSSDVEDENLEHREGVEDETVIGYQPPAETPSTNNNQNNNPGEVINIVNPNLNNNNNNNNNNNQNNDNNNNNNNNNNNQNNNTTTNTTTNTVVNNNNNNNNNNSNTTNTTNNNNSGGGSNISSDIVDDGGSGGGGAIIPIALTESVEVIAKNGMQRKFTSDIQIIQNPNLTTEEDRLAQEQNQELLKEETEELFSSITNAIESNSQIVTENVKNTSDDRKDKEFEIIKSILFKNKMNIKSNDAIEVLNNFYNNLQNHDFETMTISLFVANDKTIKVVIEDDNTLQIEIDFIDINNAERKLKYVYLKDKEARNGNMIEFYKSQRDASVTYDVDFSWISGGKIVEKIAADVSTKGTSLGNSLDNDISIQYVKGKDESFQVSIKNKIGFAVRSIDALTSDNTLYLNTLSNEEYVAIVNAVKEKTMDVLATKMTDLNLIDLNTGNDFVNRVQEEAENNRLEENNISKDDARNLIIDRVSILMGEAESAGQEVNLGILTGLTIDGYEVTSAITNEEALIVLNGHEFIIDSGFTIIDVN